MMAEDISYRFYNNSVVEIPEVDGKNKTILFIGNCEGICGDLFLDDFNRVNWKSTYMMSEVTKKNVVNLKRLFKAGGMLYSFGDEATIEYFSKTTNILNTVQGIRKKNFKRLVDKHINDDSDRTLNTLCEKVVGSGMKFDYIIMNPPYKRMTHIDFLKGSLDLLSENGKLVIVEPASWLINLTSTDYFATIKTISSKLGKHVKSVLIRNLNKDFNVSLEVPFSIMTVDMSSDYDSIEFDCFGEVSTVKSLEDCNLIGDRNLIHSIFNKVKTCPTMLKEHQCQDRINLDNIMYLKYSEICPAIPLCALEASAIGRNYDTSKNIWKSTSFGEYLSRYLSPVCYYLDDSISNDVGYKIGKDKKPTDKIQESIFGTFEELLNWKHFVYNNKLCMFMMVATTIDRHSEKVGDYLPWLVDKEYTDSEIYGLFGFTEEEINLIEKTVKKFEKNSPWFREYICGKKVDSYE